MELGLVVNTLVSTHVFFGESRLLGLLVGLIGIVQCFIWSKGWNGRCTPCFAGLSLGVSFGTYLSLADPRVFL